jgi:uncharacterized coiled-coil protein SlyX
MMDESGEADRITHLELLATYQEEINDALNEAVRRQEAEIEALKREIGWLRGIVEAMEPDGGPQPEGPPPHY